MWLMSHNRTLCLLNKLKRKCPHLAKFLPLPVQEVVLMTTSGTASDENDVKMTKSRPCWPIHWGVLISFWRTVNKLARTQRQTSLDVIFDKPINLLTYWILVWSKALQNFVNIGQCNGFLPDAISWISVDLNFRKSSINAFSRRGLQIQIIIHVDHQNTFDRSQPHILEPMS